MERGHPKFVTVATISTAVLLVVSVMVAAPVRAQFQVDGYLPTLQSSAPVWATLNAATQGNYPGGNEIFDIFIANSSHDPPQNETIENETLTAPFGTNYGIGLPSTITPGESILSTIALEIPSNFTAQTFTANLVVNAELLNAGAPPTPEKLMGSSIVGVLALPSSSNHATASQSGTISTSFFAIGLAVPSIIAVVLLALLMRARGASRRAQSATGPAAQAPKPAQGP
jgi:hypothetical protein